MSQSIHPVFGDLILDGVAVGGWLFIVALIASAWWEKRQARLLREQANRPFTPPVRRITPLRSFFKRFRSKIVWLAVISVAAGLLVWRGLNSSAADSAIGDGPANLEGGTPPASPAGSLLFGKVVTDLWKETGAAPKALNLNVDTNLFSNRGLNPTGAAVLIFGKPSAGDTANVLKTNEHPSVSASLLMRGPGAPVWIKDKRP